MLNKAINITIFLCSATAMFSLCFYLSHISRPELNLFQETELTSLSVESQDFARRMANNMKAESYCVARVNPSVLKQHNFFVLYESHCSYAWQKEYLNRESNAIIWKPSPTPNLHGYLVNDEGLPGLLHGFISEPTGYLYMYFAIVENNSPTGHVVIIKTKH